MIKQIANWVFKKTGFYVVKRPKYNGSAEFNMEELSYAPALPSANYAPWDADRSFIDVMKIVKVDNKYTLVDKYRCYELWQLTQYALRFNPSKAFLEVGVWRGGTAAVMATMLKANHSDAVLYLADTFKGVANAGAEDKFYKGGEHNDTNEELVRDLLDNKIVFNNYKILKGIFPSETAGTVASDIDFAFCHIDVDVYQSAKEVLEWVWPRLAVKGIVVFDDYGFHSCSGVTKLVESYRALTDRIIIYNLNGHAVMIKLS